LRSSPEVVDRRGSRWAWRPDSAGWLRAGSASLRLLAEAGPLAGALGLGLTLLFVFGVSRLVLVGLYFDRLQHVGDFPRLFLLGLRMDLIVTCYAVAPLALLSLLLPSNWLRRASPLFAACGVALVSVVTLLENITPGLIDEYDERPNRLVLELFSGPREILATLWSDDKPALAGVALLLTLSAWAAWHLLGQAFDRARPWGWRRRALVLPPTLLLLGIGARGTLGHQPANVSMAAFSADMRPQGNMGRPHAYVDPAVADVLDGVEDDPVRGALDQGEIAQVGEEVGLHRAEDQRRLRRRAYSGPGRGVEPCPPDRGAPYSAGTCRRPPAGGRGCSGDAPGS